MDDYARRLFRTRWFKVAIGAGALGMLPVAAQAHSLTGAGGWVDELVCLVPAAIMIVLVLVLGRNGKSPPNKKDEG